MKKFLSLLLSVMLLCSSFGTLAIATKAVSPANVSLSSVEATPGDKITLTLRIENNPGIAGLAVSLKYDTSVLTLTESKNGTLFSGFGSGKNITWDESENVTADGVLATFTFEIAENAETKEYPISVIVRSCVDDNINDVECAPIDGKVTVKQKVVPVTGLSFDKTSVSITTGDEALILMPIFSPENATNKNLTWASDDESIATVADGVVTPIKEGTVTVTATTEDGGYTASCVVTVSCGHTNKSKFAAVDSTCEMQGNNLYYVCNDCGKVFKADGVTETTVADETLPLADHTYVHFYEDPATHFAPGMKEHYTCDICMKLFDASKQEVTDSSVLMIPKIPHSYGDWQSDDVSHWHECGCGNIIDRASHSFTWKTDKPATETETGLKHEECTVCGAVRNENTVIPKLEHTHEMTHYNAVAATCKTEGNVEYWHCSKCNKNYADASGVSELSTVVTPIDTHNHIGRTRIVGKKDAGCETAGYTGDTVCNGCNAVIVKGTEIPALGHKINNTKWHTDSTTHWHECSVCGKKLDVSAHKGGTATCQNKAVCDVCGQSYGDLAAHTFVEKADAQYLKSAATCVSKAVYYKSCSVCGEKSTETFEYGSVNPNNHTGSTYVKNQKEATCYEEGYTGDICCSDCNAVITAGTVIEKDAHNPASVWSTDENYHWKECQTVGCGNIIDKAEHTGGEATCAKRAICEVCGVEYGNVNPNNHINTEIRNAVEATCTQDGYTGDTYCKDCGEKIADGSVIKAGHNYGDEYKTDAENHWKECACGNIIEKATHDFGEWAVTKATTDTEKGCKERTCSVCGYKQIAEIPVTGSTEEPTLPENSGESVTSNGQEDTTIPNTGNADSVILWSSLMLITAASVTSYEILKRKKRIK